MNEWTNEWRWPATHEWSECELSQGNNQAEYTNKKQSEFSLAKEQKKKDNVTHPSTKLLFLFLLGCEDRQSLCGWATAISLLGSNINTITYPSLTADRSSNSDEYLFSLRLEWTTTTGSHCPMVKQTTIMSTFSYLITQSSLSNHDTPPIMGTFTLSFKVVT